MEAPDPVRGAPLIASPASVTVVARLDEVPLDDIAPGDLLLIRQGDVAPVDGTLESAGAMLDQSALTGESMPAGWSTGRT